MEKSSVLIIGAGVVGLAIARELSGKLKNVVLVDKHESFGCETSSRNSEVIHAGIYYEPGSLKGQLCVEGNRLMYEICSKHNIPHRNSGKLIVAVNRNEEARLYEYLKFAKGNGAVGVKIITGKEAMALEPDIFCCAAMYCPSSGYIDTHSLMKFLEADSISKGCIVAYNNEVIAIGRSSNGYIVSLKNPSGEVFDIESEIVINSAGLHCGKIAAIAGFDIEKCGYVIKFSKGVYYRVNHQVERYPKALVYPVHPLNNIIGIHTVPDTAGGMRLGPHFFPVNEIDYSIDDSLHDLFYTNAKSYLPFLEPEDISPDMAGVHPYLYNPGNSSQDFIIMEESDKGFPGFINLINIGSPGLTAAPAIGKMVVEMV